MIDATLVPFGFLVGVYGTITGAGGGFMLVPLLLFLYPSADPARITAVSLGVVFCNSLSGSWAYARVRRIDFTSGWIFSVATVPGAVLGALAVGYLARGTFDGLFGLLLIGLGILSFLRPQSKSPQKFVPKRGMVRRTLTDALGIRYEYYFFQWQGILLSIAAGFISSLMGIGGGFIKVPIMVFLLNFPPHIATATSQFTLVVMSLAGVTVHALNGELTVSFGIIQMLLLAVGVIPGAQVGAQIARRLKGNVIVRLLGASLVLIGVSLLGRMMV